MTEDYLNEFNRFKILKEEIEEADSKKDYFFSLEFRKMYIKEQILYDDGYKGFLMFPEFISIYENNPSADYDIEDVLWVYKWILEKASSFYQISNKQIIMYFEDFKKRLIENGFSLRPYYFLYSIYMENINIEESKKSIEKALLLERDDLSDCETCELNYKIKFEIKGGNFEKAVKIAEPILRGEKSCIEVPHLTYSYFLEYYTKTKNIEKCKVYEKLLYKIIKNNKTFLSQIGIVLNSYSLYNIDKGLAVFQKHISWDLNCKNPYDIFMFELGAYNLFKQIKNTYTKDTIKIYLNRDFPLFKEDGTYIINDIINYYKNRIKDIADKFDNRNGNSLFKDMILN